jgi:hypothetical protein
MCESCNLMTTICGSPVIKGSFYVRAMQCDEIVNWKPSNGRSILWGTRVMWGHSHVTATRNLMSVSCEIQIMVCKCHVGLMRRLEWNLSQIVEALRVEFVLVGTWRSAVSLLSRFVAIITVQLFRVKLILAILAWAGNSTSRRVEHDLLLEKNGTRLSTFLVSEHVHAYRVYSTIHVVVTLGIFYSLLFSDVFLI